MKMATRTPAVLTILVAVASISLVTVCYSSEDATIGFYLADAGGRAQCSSLDPPGCADSNIPVTGELNVGYNAVLCVFNGDVDEGIAGMSFGIEYDSNSASGVDVWGWTRCADLSFPSDNWPDAGEGNRITWLKSQNCQRETPDGLTVTAVAGFFYIFAYSADRMEITTHNRLSSGPELRVANCDGVSVDIDPQTQAGHLGFSDDESEKGDLPCAEIKEEKTTWGSIKNLYENN